LHVPVEIVTAATVRESDGLAMSSRNRYLTPPQRNAATVLYRALQQARDLVAQGVSRADRIRQILADTIRLEPLARLDYAEVADAETLDSLEWIDLARPAVALVAAWVGNTRLIDNMRLTE
jgi:pantoate--beta-alanine ligase